MDKFTVVVSNFSDIVKSALPLLDIVSSGLGTGLSCALNYYERQGQKSLEAFLTQLDDRLRGLALETEEMRERFEKQADFIIEILNRVKQERAEEKITFYAGAAAEIIRNDVPDQDLKREFVGIISDLSKIELIILEALEGRRRGEVLSLSSKGGTFLRRDLIINDISLAWIDSLIRKGLVIDASVENVQSGYTPSPRKVVSRSAIRLSDLARSMIEYMRSVQSRSPS